MRAERRAQGRRRGGYAPAGEQIAQLFQSTVDAHPRCVFADAQCLTHSFEFFVLEEAEQNGGLLRGVQFCHRRVEHRADLVPSRFRCGIEGASLHSECCSFADLTATMRPHGVGGGKPCARIEPTRQHSATAKRSGLARQVGEHRLRHVLRQLFIPAHLSQRR